MGRGSESYLHVQLAEAEEVLRQHVLDNAGDTACCLERDVAVLRVGLALEPDVGSPVE